MNYILYFKRTDGTARVYDTATEEFSDMQMTDVYKQKKRYQILRNFECTDQGLIKFNHSFNLWVNQIKKNEIFEFDYLKYSSHESVCIAFLKKLCHGKYEDMEDIDKIEFDWMKKCFNAGLTYCEKGRHADCHGYDFSSTYPSILADENFHIPTQKGREKTITEFTYPKSKPYPKLELGYYRVKITCNNKNFNKAFAYSAEHVYTNISLMYAFKHQNEFDVSIELIREENNCYTYGFLTTKAKPTGVIKSESVFGKWYGHLFALKKAFPKNGLVKLMTSAMWGRLAQYNRLFMTEEESYQKKLDIMPQYDTNHKYYIREAKYNRKKDADVLEIIDTHKPFKFNIARIKPFLLSRSRAVTGELAMDYIDDVIRIHTDNVTFNKEHDDVIEKHTTKAMTLVKEDKTSGDIEWKSVGSYINHTMGHKTLDNINGNDDGIDNDDC